MSKGGGRRGARAPKAAVDVRDDKRPKIGARTTGDRPLSWRIGSVDAKHESWGWAALDMQTLGYIRTKLAQFETMTWNELLGSKHKYIPIENLSKEAQDRLASVQRDDFDGLIELRFAGKERLWGARVADVMHIVWWDPEHEVCPSNLRNT